MNAKEGGFIGGVDTSYRSSFPSKLRERPVYELIKSKQANSPPQNSYYNPPRPNDYNGKVVFLERLIIK